MTEKEKRFLTAYERSGDEGEAYRAVFGEAEDPAVCGRKMLRALLIERNAAERRRKKLEAATREHAMGELAHIAFDDIGRYLDFYEGEHGFEVHCKDGALIDTRSISEVAVGPNGRVTLKLYDKPRALKLLYDMLGGAEPEEDSGVLEALRMMGE